MQISAMTKAIQLGLALVVLCAAQETKVLTVTATMDPWRAGGYDDGSDGVTPVSFAFVPSARTFIAFPSVTGAWSCGEPIPTYGPDGTDTGCNGPFVINDPIGTFSGFDTTDFYGALVGMFLEDTLPQTAPPPLRFYVSNSTQGGIATDFRVLAPGIGEVFFIGDGRTGTGTGAFQIFAIPVTATHLYLGYVDSCFDAGVPSCYSNNIGGLRVVAQLYHY